MRLLYFIYQPRPGMFLCFINAYGNCGHIWDWACQGASECYFPPKEMGENFDVVPFSVYRL